MLEVTQEAQAQVKAYFADKPIQPIRIFLHNSGCGGPQIVMALDTPKEDDETFSVGEFEFLVDKTFLTQAQPIKVDFHPTGFKITSSMELPQGCGGCGSSSNCCS